MIKEFKGNDFQELVEDGVTLVDFFASWCGPCKMLAPEFEKLAKSTENVNFVTVDIDNHRELATNSNVASVPTLILFKDGKEISRRSGFAPMPQLKKWLNEQI